MRELSDFREGINKRPRCVFVCKHSAFFDSTTQEKWVTVLLDMNPGSVQWLVSTFVSHHCFTDNARKRLGFAKPPVSSLCPSQSGGLATWAKDFHCQEGGCLSWSYRIPPTRMYFPSSGPAKMLVLLLLSHVRFVTVWISIHTSVMSFP